MPTPSPPPTNPGAHVPRRGDDPSLVEPVDAAAAAAGTLRSPRHPLGQLGPAMDRGNPFFVGLFGAAGVAVAYLAYLAMGTLSGTLVLVSSALFLAVGLQPVVGWLTGHRVPRGLAVTVVFLVALALVGAFLAAAIPPLVDQIGQLVAQVPDYVNNLEDKSSTLGRLNARFGLEQRITSTLNGQSVIGDVLGAGEYLFSLATNLVLVIVLTAYFMVDLPRVRRFGYRFVPASRRPRAILIGDRIAAKVGSYVLGKVIISLITFGTTWVWLLVFGVPYPLLLAVFVAVFDLIPVVGSTIAGVFVAAVALTVSIMAAAATVGFFVAQRLVEDYVLIPRIVGRAVDVPGLVTVVAVVAGAALLGLVGGLVAIPIAAALQLLINELVFPRLDAE